MNKKILIVISIAVALVFPTFSFSESGDKTIDSDREDSYVVLQNIDGEDEYSSDDPETPSFSIEDYAFTLSKSKFFYDGKAHMPDVICSELDPTAYTVEYDEEYVEEREYYDEYYDDWYWEDAYYRDPTGVGTYHVHITGVAPYTGSVELTYSIVKTTISLNKTTISLYRTGSQTVKATVKNANGKTTYKSSNTKVAGVSSSGKITAKAKGTANITVQNGFAKKTVKVTVKNPKLNATKATIYLKGNKKLNVTGKIGKATFQSSNNKIASVSKSGKITAKKKGICTITVKSNGITMKCKVTVKNPYLNKTKVTLVKKKSLQLKVTGRIGKATFKSSNKKVASVSKSGKITAKKKGKCTITVKSNGIIMKCKVSVKNPPPTYVYITRTGKRYHCDYYCWGLRNANAVYKVTLSKAKKKRLTPCHVCY